jgi:acyl carrier protein
MSVTLDERLVRCFGVVFPELTPQEVGRASVASVASWDSVASINLVTVIEEEFGFEVALEELGEMASFTTIRRLLERRTT